MENHSVTRRGAMLRLLALWPASFAVAPAWAESVADGIGLVSPNVCLATPETSEGPFYLDPGLVRADITEGRVGTPLRLKLQLVDEDCRPMGGVRVDVWHCDAGGSYSGVAGPGRGPAADTRAATFLRGTQFAAADGVVTFETISPGWYRGRIHSKVFLDERTVLTSQVFFPDGASERVYRDPPYRDRAAGQDTTNATDGIARRAGPRTFARVAELPAGWEATLVVGMARG